MDWRFRLRKAGGLDAVWVLPFFLLGIDTAFTVFFYLAAGGAPTKDALFGLMSYGTRPGAKVPALSALYLYIPILFWYRPIERFMRGGRPELAEVVKRRIAAIYPAAFALFGFLLAVKVGLHLFAFRSCIVWREFFALHLPCMLLVVAVELCFTVIFIDNVMGGEAGRLMEKLYSREELHILRQGGSISLFYKIFFLLFSTAVVPMLMLYFFMRTLQVPGFQREAVNSLLIHSFTAMVLGVAVVLGTFQRPVNGLIEKMKRLASGDFDVKTRIYFADEIAQIKASFNRMVDQVKERETLRETFGKYVSVEVAKKLMGSGKLDLGGEEIEATVLFCDIRNFTPMSEKLTPRQVVDFLNSYFSYVTEPIMKNNGVINKFMGDAVMAVYTPILGSQDHVRDALRSAVGMREALARFNGGRTEPVRFGIGIQTGSLVAGNVGTLARLEYTVIGDTVNVASRLESATKEAGVDILVSDEVRSRAKGGWEFEPVGPVSLKGKSGALSLFAVRAALLALLAAPAGAADPALLKKVEGYASGPLKNASWGISVKDAGTGADILSYHPEKSLIPASALKLLVAAAALSELGPEHRFKTGLCVGGRDIVLKGGGDPTFGSDLVKGSVPMDEVLSLLAGKLRRVEGGIVADNTLFTGLPVPGSWPYEDLGNYYAASADALSIHDNLYKLFFAPGKKEGDDAPVLRAEPEVPGLEFTNLMRTGPEGSGDQGYLYAAPGQYKVTARGTVPAGPPEFAIKGAIPEPARFAAQALKAYLEKSGLRVKGAVRVGTAECLDRVYEHPSPPLQDIVAVMLKRSFNLYAEILARDLAVARGKPGSIQGGVEAVKDFLAGAGIEVSGMRLFDFCGLSRSNFIRAETFTDLLVFMAKGKLFDTLRSCMVSPGQGEAFGHIRSFGKGTALEGNLRIKSGSLAGVRSYCGYVRTRSGRWLAFSYLINNYACAPSEIERIHEELISRLAEL
ncbi:MAG: D-alanyl-D-alanine carboxypeptidase/D-alanyl-D-alanine-endopeptidase [Elusimicrobiota bacterium]